MIISNLLKGKYNYIMHVWKWNPKLSKQNMNQNKTNHTRLEMYLLYNTYVVEISIIENTSERFTELEDLLDLKCVGVCVGEGSDGCLLMP